MEGVTPRPAATLVMVRDGDGGPEVLMMRRPHRGAFGGLWVFPGGALEESDHSDRCRRAVSVPVDVDDLPWRAAAIRETAEEVGVLLVEGAPFLQASDVGGTSIYEEVLSNGRRLDGGRLRLLSQWVTPEGSPTRFDARFYLTRFEGDPVLTLDPAEAEEATWVNPGEALDRMSQGVWPMVTPTVHHLRWLEGFEDADEAWEAAGRLTPERVTPLIESDGSRVRLRLPRTAELP
jgi:recombination protein RecT